MPSEINPPNNFEIDQVLKEFEAKASAEQIQQTVKTSEVFEVPKMVQLVMKWSGFKEQKQAEYVLLGFVVVAIGVSLYLFFGRSSSYQEKIIFSLPAPATGTGDSNSKP